MKASLISRMQLPKRLKVDYMNQFNSDHCNHANSINAGQVKQAINKLRNQLHDYDKSVFQTQTVLNQI